MTTHQPGKLAVVIMMAIIVRFGGIIRYVLALQNQLLTNRSIVSFI